MFVHSQNSDLIHPHFHEGRNIVIMRVAIMIV